MIKGSHHTKEFSKKSRISHLGKHYSSKTEFKKGLIPWNKGKKGIFSPEVLARMSNIRKGKTGSMLGKKHSNETREKLRISHLGHIPSLETRIKMGLAHKGRIVSEQTKNKLSEGRMGEKHWAWNPDREYVRHNSRDNKNADYLIWARTVKRRDKFKCRLANENCFGNVVAHHILPWRSFVEERYNINNGITLCHYHHPRKAVDEQRLAPTLQEIVRSNIY